jgi:hypothetical protein
MVNFFDKLFKKNTYLCTLNFCSEVGFIVPEKDFLVISRRGIFHGKLLIFCFNPILFYFLLDASLFFNFAVKIKMFVNK